LEDFEAGFRPERWSFSNGGEFPGARGQFERAADAAHEGGFGGRLRFDFSGGGAYVSAIFHPGDLPDMSAVRVWVKKPAGAGLVFRYTDATGQTLQKNVFTLDDQWCDVEIGIDAFTLHWGGANDGVVHGAPKTLAFNLDNTGPRQGALLLDDVRYIQGKPGPGTGSEDSEYAAYRFDPGEKWTAHSWGNGGRTRLDGRTLTADFSKGVAAIQLSTEEIGLIGTPKEMILRARGDLSGHPVRVRLATHFMTFVKSIGQFTFGPDGISEIRTAMPPGEGWDFYGGENDGKIHGPLRLSAILLDRGDRNDTVQVELLELRIRATCPRQRRCILSADLRDDVAVQQGHDGAAGRSFVARVRGMGAEPIPGTLLWSVRDWQGNEVATASSQVVIPVGGAGVESAIPVPAGAGEFLEATVSLVAPDQLTPPAQAYWTMPVDDAEDPRLDPASPIGMGLYLCRYGGDPVGLEQMDRAAGAGARAGVKWSREDFTWPHLETKPGQYNWHFYDQMVATAKRHGVSLYGVLAGWGPGVKPYTTEGIDAYCRWAAAVAEHYQGDVQYWEVWNEPNIFFWQGPRDMYAQLLTRAGAAIRKANPNAQVLGCSTSGIDSKFIRRTMDLGGEFDALTIHPYRTVLDDRAFVDDLRKVSDLVKRPDGTARPVWITEMGWATFTPHNSLAQDFQPTTQRRQAELLGRAYVDAVASGNVASISWYDFRNDGTDPTNFEHNMGIMTRDFRPKPAYRALAAVARVLKGKIAAAAPDLGKGLVAYRFTDPDGKRPVIALWAIGEPAIIDMPAGVIQMIDLMGRAAPCSGLHAKLVLPIEQPMFLVLAP
jgi:hypothetical protein